MKFLLENNLSRLGKWLRFLGYDVRVFEGEVNVREVFGQRDRVFLTTSKRLYDLLSQRGLRVFLVPREDWRIQLCMVIKRFGLSSEPRLDLCALCGMPLERVRKEEFSDRIPPSAYDSAYDFTYCRRCDYLFWKGTHYEGMLRTLKEVLELC